MLGVRQANWSSNTTTHVVASHPALYVSGHQMKAVTAFAVTGVTANERLVVKGEADGYTFLGTNDLAAWATSWSVTNYATANLPANKVDCLNPLTIHWSYASLGSADFIQAGTSTNWVYVTLEAPLTSYLFHTVVHLACANTGATNAESVFDNTWENFGGTTNVKTWDGGASLHYYKAGLAFTNAAQGLVELMTNANHNGQCGAWMVLLGTALAVNAHMNWTWTQVLPPTNCAYMLIKEWEFGDANTNNADFQWHLELSKGTSGEPEMVPLSALSGTVTPEDGLAGQNTPTPAQKIFGLHWVLRNNTNAKYYDPSYGRVYTNAADFQNQVIVGYAKPDPDFSSETTIRLLVSETNSTLGTPRFITP